MKNKFNRCCCGDIPPPIVPKCRICEIDCDSTTIGGNAFIYNQRHPDEGKEGFLAQGRLVGVFRFSDINGQLRLIFNHNQITGTYDTLDISFTEGVGFNRPVRFVLRRENGIVASNTQVLIGATVISQMLFCFHFDADGNITIVLFNNDVIHARWSSQLDPGIGGGVGYRLTGVTFIGSLPYYYRSASEIIDEQPCPGCTGAPCDPCCPDGATINWLLTIPGNLINEAFKGCMSVGGQYILEPVTAFGGCNWIYGSSVTGTGVSYDIDKIDVPGCFNYTLVPPGAFPVRWYIEAFIRHLGSSKCKLEVAVWTTHARLDTLCCAGCEVVRWTKIADIEHLCGGSHVLGLEQSEDLLCSGFPPTITLQAV